MLITLNIRLETQEHEHDLTPLRGYLSIERVTVSRAIDQPALGTHLPNLGHRSGYDGHRASRMGKGGELTGSWEVAGLNEASGRPPGPV